MTPSRRALLAVGVATIAVSMVLSIAPVIAANGNGNSGNAGNGGGNAGSIKIHDATTGVETAENDNDPHVCAFWVAFYAADPFESGTWQLLSWAPTGDGSVVASGTYDTTGDGLDATATLDPVPGHYRFEWTAAGSNNSKHKTLWVDETCGSEDEDPPSEDETPPSEDQTPPSGDETPPSEDETPPSEDETPPSQDAVPPSQDQTPPSEEQTPPSGDETPPSGDETPPSEDESPPSQNAVPPSQDQTPPSQDQNGESGILAGNPNPPVVENPAPDGVVATGGATTTLPDTSIPLGLSGVLAAMGLLLIVAAHAGTRRRPLRG
ncbi:MAG TPA: hypothetical protein VGB34_02680 [Candidatus Limnocylindria bacterium]